VKLLVKMDPARLEKSLNIPAGEITRLSLPLPKDAKAVELTLPDDAVAVDNHAVLLRDAPAILRVDIAVENDALHEAITRAVTASGRARITNTKPHVRFVSSGKRKMLPGCWDIEFIGGEKSNAVLGPFVLDKHHPLLEGMTLEGVVLSKDDEIGLGGRPLVAAADATLMSWREEPSGDRRVLVQCLPEKTTWLESIDFPVFVANALRWRESALPEQVRPNVRVGEKVQVTLAEDRESCAVKMPSGESVALTPLRREVTFTCDEPGRYDVALDDVKLSVAANVLFRDESDIMAAASDEWGKWEPVEAEGYDYWSAAAALLLLVLAVWVLHGVLLTLSVRRSSRLAGPSYSPATARAGGSR